jgi:3-oxoacyl-[acyl-carrier protein] reductase
MSDQTLQNRVVLVTGGSGDIGSATCRRLARAGAQVVVNYRNNEEAARAVLGSLDGEGHAICYAAVDKTEDVQVMADFVRDRYGRLDVLINNAGFTRYVDHADLDALDDELIDQIFQVNWRGAFACVRAFRDLLQAHGNGVVINISSIAARTGQGSNVAYCASKAAMDSMARSLGRALAPRIRVLSVAPGLIDGPYASSFDPTYIRSHVDNTPLGRIATGDDVAETIYAAIVHMPMTTGTYIPVDGGRPLV